MTAQLLAAIAAVAVPAGYVGYVVGHLAARVEYGRVIRDLEASLDGAWIQLRALRRELLGRQRRRAA